MELLGVPLHVALAIASALLAIGCAILLFLRKAKDGAPKANGAVAKASPVKKAVEDPSLADPSKPVIRLLYGTQTGTAERFAKQLAKELAKKYGDGTIVDVLDVENYAAAKRLQREKLLVLCMATYGDGEPTDNAAEFYTWLLKEAEAVDAGDKEQYLQVCVGGL